MPQTKKVIAERSRSPNDGKPYYCAECGAGFDEFMACEEPGCKLENAADAFARVLDRSRR